MKVWKISLRQLAVCAAALAVSLQASAYELKPFTASYTADWKQLPVSGSAERSLSKKGEQWQLDFKASMLLASLSESSVFSLDDDAFMPQSYEYKRSGLGKSKDNSMTFDWKTKQITGKEDDKAYSHPLSRGMMDKSTYQIQLQHDVAEGKKSMSYQVVEGDDMDTYDFRVLGDEKVRTKAGLIDAVKVERVRDPTKTERRTILWFAKDWDYLLVRLYQKENDGKEYQIMLKEGSVDGKAVSGVAE